MFSESDLLPLSALQHLVFCERQCALIHIEGIWAENLLTAEGRVLHERTHQAGSELKGEVLVARAVRLRSLSLGLTGVADVVEFHREKDGAAAQGAGGGGGSVRLPGRSGLWHPFPVEYKRGRPKKDDSDKVQLCAQAMCLEEMLDTEVPNGALFYGKTRRRLEISFDERLRSETERLSQRLHGLIRGGVTPTAVYEKKCDRCSLYEVCRPKSVRSSHSAVRYLDRAIRTSMEEEIVTVLE